MKTGRGKTGEKRKLVTATTNARRITAAARGVGLDCKGVGTRSARTTTCNSKQLGYKLVPGYCNGIAKEKGGGGKEIEQLFPLDAIFQFERLNNRGWVWLVHETERLSERNGERRERPKGTRQRGEKRARTG